MKYVRYIGICLLVALVLFMIGVYLFHIFSTQSEIDLLKEQGYYNPVSVGDYKLNVAMFGNKSGKHTIVGLAGLGSGDFSVSARKMTKELEKENLVVFVDRAGYGFSDDTNEDMTLERIVEDYRKALQNAGIQPPYILMPHSIGGAYANHWCTHYPEEIEAIAFVDGSQLNANAFADEEVGEVGLGDQVLAFLAKMGFSRMVLRDYHYHYPDNFTEEEQKLGDALMLMTLDSIAPVSESYNLAEIAQTAFNELMENDVPKLYICASWGIQTKEDLIEMNKWVNRQIEINDFDLPLRSTRYDDPEDLQEILDNYKKAREETIYPYAEKMGNCQVICVAGDHMIYQQKPEECGSVIKEFIETLS